MHKEHQMHMPKAKKKGRVEALFGIDYPIIQAPMNFIAGPRLAAAVSAAGGLGVLGPNADKRPGEKLSTEERIIRAFEQIRSLTSRPVGINVIIPEDGDEAGSAYAACVIDAARTAGVNAVFAVGGLSGALFGRIKTAGMKLAYRPLTPGPAIAREAEQMGVDLFIATGFDEGGWLPERQIGTFAIVPVIADAVDIPVAAAGAVNDARGVRAAFALGAEAVYVGTRFIVTDECDAHDCVKRMIVQGCAEELVFAGKSQRSMPTSCALRAAQGMPLEPGKALRLGMLAGDMQEGIVCVNTAIDLIKTITPAADVVAELAAGLPSWDA